MLPEAWNGCLNGEPSVPAPSSLLGLAPASCCPGQQQRANDPGRQSGQTGLPGGAPLPAQARIKDVCRGAGHKQRLWLPPSASSPHSPAGDGDRGLTTSWRPGVPRFPHSVTTFSTPAAPVPSPPTPSSASVLLPLCASRRASTLPLPQGRQPLSQGHPTP